MYIPRDFGSPEQNFWNLIEKSILCDVAVERQVEITGPDAFKFTQLLTPRDLSNVAIGQCKYVLITNNNNQPGLNSSEIITDLQNLKISKISKSPKSQNDLINLQNLKISQFRSRARAVSRGRFSCCYGPLWPSLQVRRDGRPHARLCRLG